MTFSSVQCYRIFSALAIACCPCSALQGAINYSDLLRNLPLRFEENRGQAPSPARYIARGPGYELRLESTRNLLLWTDPQGNNQASIETRFLGANSHARLRPQALLEAKTNYLIGNVPANWHREIPNYGEVRVAGIYPGIDLVFYGKSGAVEYDFVLRPGANPELIRFEISGAKSIRLTPDGDLVLPTRAGDACWRKPVLYQESERGRIPIDGTFELLGGKRVHFRVGAFDRHKALVIDPKLSYASYFGAPVESEVSFQNASAIGVDSSGNAYIAGITASNNLPVTAGVVQTAFGGSTLNIRYFLGDAFVAKFTPSGMLSYVTYLGGSGDDAATGIAVDSAGDAYLVGITNSKDFPTTPGVLQRALKGSGGNSCVTFGDAFVAKLNPSGNQLLYSTYLGGSLDDFGWAIQIDAQGDAYVAGATLSSDFPVVNAVQSILKGSGGEPGRPSCNGGPLFNAGDAFVAKLNPTATQLVFSTYLGGSLDDAALAIAVDPAQNIYVGGFTLSTDFPTTGGAFQTTFGGRDPINEFFNFGDGFVAKLSPSGATLAFSTYLGGSGDDVVYGMTSDRGGTVYITGSTSSPNFPTTSTAVQSAYGGYLSQELPFLIEQNIGDAFVARMNPQGTKLIYSTYLGGSANDSGQAIAVDPSGLIYMAGWTDSKNFPVSANAMQPAFGGDSTSVRSNYLPSGDGFLAVIDPNATHPVYSTYLGGQYNDQLLGLALDTNGNIWTTGGTQSPNFPVTASAAQKSYTGGAAALGGPNPTDPIYMQAAIAEFSTTGTPGGPVLNAITNAASNKAGVISPGMIFVAYGSNFGPASLLTAAVDPVTGLLSGTLAGASLLFDNIPAPLVYINATSVAGTVPYEVAGEMTSQVVMEVEGQRSAPLTVPVQPTAPGVFSINFSGTGPSVAFNDVNGVTTLNSTDHPVPVGAALEIFATGEGQTTPPGQDGVFSTTPVPKPTAPVAVSIGGVPQTNILYAGAIPGEPPGVLQVNIVVGKGTPSGIQPLVVQVGGVNSEPGMTVVVK
jgi:uncharacterized protein (TIGR03437 family)